MAENIVTDPKDAGPVNRAVGAPPERRNGRLTRAGMLQVVKQGGSFHWPVKDADGNDGLKFVSRVEDVPSEGEVAQHGNDTDEADRVRKENEATIERLRAENAALRNVQPKPAATPAVTPTGPAAPKK